MSYNYSGGHEEEHCGGPTVTESAKPEKASRKGLILMSRGLYISGSIGKVSIPVPSTVLGMGLSGAVHLFGGSACLKKSS